MIEHAIKAGRRDDEWALGRRAQNIDAQRAMFRVDQRIGDELPAPENVAVVLQGHAVFGAGFDVGHGKGGHAAMRQAAQVFDIQGGIQAAHDVGETERVDNWRVNTLTKN